jgi:hypothetical protein
MMKLGSSDFRFLLLAAMFLSMMGCTVHPADPLRADLGVSGGVAVGDEHSRVEIMFSTDDRRYIHDYYYRDYDDGYYDRKKSKKLPPGLAKRDELPPGLQKQIRRNGQLPPGLQGRHLPHELERRLSPLPPDYVRMQVGRDIVLINQKTRITVDVIKNIFP